VLRTLHRAAGAPGGNHREGLKAAPRSKGVCGLRRRVETARQQQSNACRIVLNTSGGGMTCATWPPAPPPISWDTVSSPLPSSTLRDVSWPRPAPNPPGAGRCGRNVSHEIGGGAGGHVAQVIPPPEVLRTNAAGVGLLLAGSLDPAFGVRKLLSTWRGLETLAVVAARRSGGAMESSEHWINFFTPPRRPLTAYRSGEVLQTGRTQAAAGFSARQDRVRRFDPSVTPALGERDLFATPYTRFGHDFAPGVEVLANSCANL